MPLDAARVYAVDVRRGQLAWKLRVDPRVATRRRSIGLGSRSVHGGFRRKEDHTLECDLLVVHETSMIDVPLMHALLKAVA